MKYARSAFAGYRPYPVRRARLGNPVLCLLITVCLLFCSSVLAEAVFTVQYDGEYLLTLRYDNSLFRLDTDSYLGSGRNDHRWLGTFYNGTYAIDLCADRYDGLTEYSTPGDLSAHLCSLYSSESCTVLETFGGNIPFVLFSMNGQYGQSYYAACLYRGYAVSLELYRMLGGADSDGLAVLKSLLQGIS